MSSNKLRHFLLSQSQLFLVRFSPYTTFLRGRLRVVLFILFVLPSAVALRTPQTSGAGLVVCCFILSAVGAQPAAGIQLGAVPIVTMPQVAVEASAVGNLLLVVETFGAGFVMFAFV
ncbi:hypothetical protein FB45DRAFT_915530 [Roridomyces roridus]|uniref:Uncharacterized protein n=1 Tax=Roridomyces roridus TaxID=1738132 RepID=A0AAD7FNF2_9AGAR|nr:hypothetical protein FB45DRAFT_915530 [Roridomyces roridus]